MERLQDHVDMITDLVNQIIVEGGIPIRIGT